MFTASAISTSAAALLVVGYLQQKPDMIHINESIMRSIHSIHNVVDGDVLQAMWEELAGKVGQRDQLIIC